MTVDIAEQIKSHIDDAAPPLTIEEILRNDRAHNLDVDRVPRWRPSGRSLVVAAAALVAVLTVAVAVLVSGRGPLSTSIAATEERLPVRGEDASWERISDVNDAFVVSDVIAREVVNGTTSSATSQVGINDVAVGPDLVVAVGSESIGFASKAAVWVSSTLGTDWQRLDAEAPELTANSPPGDGQPTDMQMTDAVLDDGRLVVAGEAWSGDNLRWPVAWLHDDNGWQRHDLPTQSDSSFVTVVELVRTTEGFTAIGVDNSDMNNGSGNGLLTWTSTDGTNWTQLGTSGLNPGEYIFAAAAVNNRILAVGQTGDPAKPTPALWLSDDGGSTWLAQSPPPIDPDHPVGSLVGLEIQPERVVVLGQYSTTGDISYTELDDGTRSLDDEQLLTVWSTDDGTTWNELATFGGPNELIVNPHLVRAFEGYMIAYSNVTAANDGAALWILGDDGTLTDVGYPDADTDPNQLVFTGIEHLLFTSPSIKASQQALDNGDPQPEIGLWRLTSS